MQPKRRSSSTRKKSSRPQRFAFDRRASGVLLHPTSLPGPFGSGDLGPEAHKFVDVLAAAGQRWWQMLPVGPPGDGNSPYSAASAFAGNPYLVSPEVLVTDGLLERKELKPPFQFDARRVDFARSSVVRTQLLGKAFSRFLDADGTDSKPFKKFVRENEFWLEDYALFGALKRFFPGKPWSKWPRAIRTRNPDVLTSLRSDIADRISYERFVQYQFDRQWQALKARCAKHNIGLIGDIPIFVAFDSAEVWANPHLFLLDQRTRKPTVVSGCPPDFFNADGQMWNHPHYNWPAHAKEKYRWWVERFRHTMRLFDGVRIDHFIGFHRVWAIPAGRPNARKGRYTPGPGHKLFDAIQRNLGDVPIIAEDLGSVTPEVFALRDRFNFPGMRVLQFGFGDGGEYHLPHNYPRRSVVYTGTHDNDTTAGWFAKIPAKERRRVLAYTCDGSSNGSTSLTTGGMGAKGGSATWPLVRAALSSVADTAIFPLQDLLDLGSESRMNVPGQAEGNWGWRLKPGALTSRLAKRLRAASELYERT